MPTSALMDPWTDILDGLRRLKPILQDVADTPIARELANGSSSPVWTTASLTAKGYALKQRIALLKQAISLHEQEQTHYSVLEQRHHNASRPLLRLPTEITLEIFQYLRDDDVHFRPINLAAVCHSWNALVLGDSGPSLWTRAVISMSKTDRIPSILSRMQVHLRRSRDLPMNFVVRDSATSRSDIRPIIELIHMHAGRWRCIVVPRATFKALFPLDGAYQNLRALCLTVDPDPLDAAQHAGPELFTAAGCSSLRELRFLDPHLVPRIPSLINTPTQGSLCSTLNLLTPCGSGFVRELLKVLPCLKRFVWCADDGELDVADVQMPSSLRHLSIASIDPVKRLMHVCAPTLRRLYLHQWTGEAGRPKHVACDPRKILHKFPDLCWLGFDSYIGGTILGVSDLLGVSGTLHFVSCIAELSALTRLMMALIRTLALSSPTPAIDSPSPSQPTSDGGDICEPERRVLALSAVNELGALKDASTSVESRDAFLDSLRALAMMGDIRRALPSVMFEFPRQFVDALPGLELVISMFPDFMEVAPNRFNTNSGPGCSVTIEQEE